MAKPARTAIRVRGARRGRRMDEEDVIDVARAEHGAVNRRTVGRVLRDYNSGTRPGLTVGDVMNIHTGGPPGRRAPRARRR